jgi:hypothetical protein
MKREWNHCANVCGKKKEESGSAGSKFMINTRRRKNAIKCDRAVEFGWSHFDYTDGKYKSVRLPNLGGVRALRVAKSSTKADLITKGKELFFPGGKSVYGDTLDHTFDLALDVKGNVRLTKHETIEHLSDKMALKKIRLYLLSKSDEDDELGLDTATKKEDANNNIQHSTTVISETSTVETPSTMKSFIGSLGQLTTVNSSASTVGNIDILKNSLDNQHTSTSDVSTLEHFQNVKSSTTNEENVPNFKHSTSTEENVLTLKSDMNTEINSRTAVTITPAMEHVFCMQQTEPVIDYNSTYMCANFDTSQFPLFAAASAGIPNSVPTSKCEENTDTDTKVPLFVGQATGAACAFTPSENYVQVQMQSEVNVPDLTIDTVPLHRGLVYSELKKYFMDNQQFTASNLKIHIKMILPNGSFQLGEDVGVY